MKKYIVLMLIFVMTFFCSACSKKRELNDLETIKERGYLIVGVKEDSPPFGFYKDEKLTGIDIELSKYIADNIFDNPYYTNIKFVSVTPQNRFSKLNSGEVDFLAAIVSINDKRKLIIDFSIPYFSTGQKIMVNKDSKISHLSYFNTKGTIAVILGTTGENVLHLAAPNARIVAVRTYKEAVNLLENNLVDAVLGDDCVLKGYNDGRFRIINRAYSKEYYAVALRKSDKSKELLQVVNTSITSFLDDKKMNALKREYGLSNTPKLLVE